MWRWRSPDEKTFPDVYKCLVVVQAKDANDVNKMNEIQKALDFHGGGELLPQHMPLSMSSDVQETCHEMIATACRLMKHVIELL